MTGAGCIGIDGCRHGWVGATRRGVVVAASLEALLEQSGIDPARDIVAIDMPIGLPERGRRRCETLARALLSPRRHHSVFWIATREAVYASTQDEASRINRERGGKGVSAQSYRLFAKIRELDGWLRREPHWRSVVHETHPELAFAVLNGSSEAPDPIRYPKKSGLGAHRRLSLLFRRFDTEHFRQTRRSHGYATVADDDIADAYACLFSAERIAAGRHATLPVNPPVDDHGLPMRICF